MPILFVLNPEMDASKRAGIEEAIDEAKLLEDYTVFYKNIDALSAEQLAPYDHFVAVGGDGTIYHTINALMKTRARKFSLIPAGSGNDFARTLKLDNEIEPILQAICEGKARKMDLGKWNARYFLNVASVGVDADINAMNTAAYKQLGALSYSLQIIKAVARYRFRKIALKGIREKAWTIFTFGNGGYYGGGFPIFAEADPFSGKLLWIGAERSRLKFFLPFILSLFIKKSHLFKKDIHRCQVQSMDFEILEEANVNLDGENFFEKGPVHVSLLPGEIDYIGP